MGGQNGAYSFKYGSCPFMGVSKIADESATTVFGQSLPSKVLIGGLRLAENANAFSGLKEVLQP
jgi:hypothetical protein